MSVSMLRPLGDVADFLSGFAWKAKQFSNDPIGMPIIRIQNVGADASTDFKYWPESYADRFVISRGDLLLTLSGSFRTVVWTGPNALLNQRIVKVSAHADTDTRWLFYALEEAMARIASMGRHALVSNVALSDLKELQINVPPLEEQKRIAGILDQADALRRLRSRALDKLNTLGQSIFHEMFGDPVSNSKGFEVTSLSSVATFRSGATPAKSNADFWGGETPWVTPKDMKVTWINGAKDNISDKALSEGNMKLVAAGTPLIVVRGMILAHTVPLALTSVNCTINQDMKAIDFDRRIIPTFGLFNLKCQHDSLLSRVSTAAHGTKRFDMAELGRVQILLPDLAKQKAFVDAINQAESITRNAKVGLQKQDALFASLQHRAFRGEL
ncbi:restriction endonuclease subunit S [Ruegeria arenilitoris]|uniref:restriction endonuclease subunit S n=1 Tax=Ruegeria arenilitoris TaxID=1173585 RepID=UPI001480BE9E|nr:restriction endonuclease subunit S [Ruegeria arenilitoris]